MRKMRTHKPHPKKHWTNASMKNAIAELKQTGTSKRVISKKQNIPTATLQRQLKEILHKVGRKPVFTKDEEADVKDCIKGTCLCILVAYFNCHQYFNILYSIIWGGFEIKYIPKNIKTYCKTFLKLYFLLLHIIYSLNYEFIYM